MRLKQQQRSEAHFGRGEIRAFCDDVACVALCCDGTALLERGLLCGLAHVGLGPRQCAATPVLPCVEFVGAEMVSGTPGAGVCACVVAVEAEKVSCFSDVALGYLQGVRGGSCCDDLSVGCMFMDIGDFLEFPNSCMFCEDAENMRSSCDCGFRGEDSCSQDCSNGALDLLAVFACVYRFQPFIGAMRFQPFVVVLLALCVASSVSRRQSVFGPGGEPARARKRRAGGETGVFH